MYAVRTCIIFRVFALGISVEKSRRIWAKDRAVNGRKKCVARALCLFSLGIVEKKLLRFDDLLTACVWWRSRRKERGRHDSLRVRFIVFSSGQIRSSALTIETTLIYCTYWIYTKLFQNLLIHVLQWWRFNIEKSIEKNLRINSSYTVYRSHGSDRNSKLFSIILFIATELEVRREIKKTCIQIRRGLTVGRKK